MSYVIRLIGLGLILVSCNTGNLQLLADLPNSLKEISAAETTGNSSLIWVIEDAGNSNTLYGLDAKGNIVKDIEIDNANNEDWEDLTSDSQGNIYIGDFGNNSKNRANFSIYKVEDPTHAGEHKDAQKISYTLPETMKSEDFEAFFLFSNNFYIFSKSDKEGVLIKVPNRSGSHVAKMVTEFNLDGKDNAITSADISTNGKTVVLLNHEKLWKLSNFSADNFFSGTIEKRKFGHKSQKEGICFKSDTTLLITDERDGNHDGNLYAFDLD